MHVLCTLVALVLRNQLHVVVHLVDIQFAVWTHELASFAIVLHVPSQAILHLRDACLAEWTLLLICTLRASTKMAFSMLVSKFVTASVWTIELAHVEYVFDLARNLLFFKFLLAKRTYCVASQPLSQTSPANKPFAVTALGKVFKHIGADWAHKLSDDFLEFRLCTFDTKFFEFVC